MIRVAFACAAACLLVAGCGNSGFRPMYASRDRRRCRRQRKARPARDRTRSGPRRSAHAQRVDLSIDRRRPRREARLSSRDHHPRVDLADPRQDRRQLRGSIYNLDASFTLVRIADKKAVLTGRSYGRAGFERLQSIFANVRAREDAENRAAKTVGEELKSRLSIYLANA